MTLTAVFPASKPSRAVKINLARVGNINVKLKQQLHYVLLVLPKNLRAILVGVDKKK
ncbi:hypothetical protein [Shewanella sp. MBTL60-007]|uniref:hypothetical protein n=1 Tax=Shewanella sp. MBTL60-007 TaxID=2815911 RepID=UPI001C7EC5F4|nr:hypothetical protein [Shewanella sp. MBTL60-007]